MFAKSAFVLKMPSSVFNIFAKGLALQNKIYVKKKKRIVIFVSLNQTTILNMEQIQSLLESVVVLMPGANITQLSAIIQGIYAISSGGVTQLNISRYSPISYRGVTRFMSYKICWHKVYVEQLRWYLQGKVGMYLLVIDDLKPYKIKSVNFVGQKML